METPDGESLGKALADVVHHHLMFTLSNQEVMAGLERSWTFHMGISKKPKKRNGVVYKGKW